MLISEWLVCYKKLEVNYKIIDSYNYLHIKILYNFEGNDFS